MKRLEECEATQQGAKSVLAFHATREVAYVSSTRVLLEVLVVLVRDAPRQMHDTGWFDLRILAGRVPTSCFENSLLKPYPS